MTHTVAFKTMMNKNKLHLIFAALFIFVLVLLVAVLIIEFTINGWNTITGWIVATAVACLLATPLIIILEK